MCAAPKKKTARKSSKKAAKKKSSNAGRKAGVSDCVYITRSLFDKVCEHLGGDHRDKNFKVSRKWLESLGYDPLEVKNLGYDLAELPNLVGNPFELVGNPFEAFFEARRADALSYAKIAKAEESRGRVNDSNLHRLKGDTSPRRKLGRGEQSGSTHVYVPAAALLNLLDDRKRYERAYGIFDRDEGREVENVFVTADEKAILDRKRDAKVKGKIEAERNGEEVSKSVEKALGEELERTIKVAVSGAGKGKEESTKERVLAIWSNDALWKEREALTASEQIASYLSLVDETPSHNDDNTWKDLHDKVTEINKELMQKDLLRYASVPTKVAREFRWFLDQSHPKQNLGEAKTLLFKRKKVVEIPVKRTWLEAITVVKGDKDGGVRPLSWSGVCSDPLVGSYLASGALLPQSQASCCK